MNIHTTRIQRIVITAPNADWDMAQAFIRQHGYTITHYGPLGAPTFEIGAEKVVNDYRVHEVTQADWARMTTPPPDGPTAAVQP